MTEISKDWPITRAELLGAYMPSESFSKLKTSITILVYLLAITGLSFLLGSILFEDSFKLPWEPFFLLTVGPFVFMVLDVHARVRRRRWSQAAPRIWDADGCICPWCGEDVRNGPCTAHGVGPQHRSLLIDFYSEPVLQESEDKNAPTLIQVVPRPPGIRHLPSRLKIWLNAHKTAFNPPDSSPTRRLGAFLKLAAIYYPSTTVLLVGLFLFVPSLFPNPDGMGAILLMIWLFIPLGVVFTPKPNFKRVCANCFQQCPRIEQARCSECGRDLQIPGATTRLQIAEDVEMPKFTLSVVFLLLLVLSSSIGGWVMDSLPSGARRVFFGQIGVPAGYFKDIDVPNLTPEEAKTKADLALYLARPGGPGIPFHFDRNLIGIALEQNLLPESYREKAARTTTSATLELERSDEGWEIAVTPRIDPSLLGSDQLRFAFGGVSIDGGPWSPGASRTLIHEDLEPHHRAKFAKPRPEGTYRVPIELPPGRYEVEARCWILLEAGNSSSQGLEFDLEGNPMFPPEAVVYELPIVETITVR